jgi:hypothetical protein
MQVDKGCQVNAIKVEARKCWTNWYGNKVIVEAKVCPKMVSLKLSFGNPEQCYKLRERLRR